MNNQQFRNLLLNKAGANQSPENGRPSATPGRDGASPATLGSRMRSSIPMTPRTVMGSGSIDFKRQLAERDREGLPQKRFRSSAAPKGTKLAQGYTDRTLLRESAEEDDKASRVQALEEQMKLGQIDEATFRTLRDQIVGGDIASTHLVKGLDFKLLERVRRGEDVLNGPSEKDGNPVEGEKAEDVDDEFEKLEQKEVAPVAREKTSKKGEMAPPALRGPVAGRKRTRDEILAELKAARQAAKAAAQPSLGSKFKKISDKPTETNSRIEIDERGREVLITVGEDGRVKRKVRKAQAGEKVPDGSNGLLVPDKNAKPLGMEVPSVPPPPVEEDDGDIFEGAGLDYDPLGGLGEEDDDSDEDEETAIQPGERPEPPSSTHDTEGTEKLPIPRENEATKVPRNYFGTSTTEPEAAPETSSNPLTDPTILAAIKRASKLAPASSDPEKSSEDTVRLEERRRKLLESADRDDIDIDMGFGSSRLEDEEDFEDKRVKLSVWGEDDEGEGGGRDRGGQKQRKRGQKKKKGDKNSVADVMRVMESRK